MGRRLGTKDMTSFEFSDDVAMSAIRKGVRNDNATVAMPAYQDKLSDTEIASLVAYVRQMASVNSESLRKAEERQGSGQPASDIGGENIQSNQSSNSGNVTVKADDDTYEVFVDAKFVGNTPAKLNIASGMHVIEVKKSGFKDYKKEINVSKGSELNLRAVLEHN